MTFSLLHTYVYFQSLDHIYPFEFNLERETINAYADNVYICDRRQARQGIIRP